MRKSKIRDQNEKGNQHQGWHLNSTRMQLKWFLKWKLQLRTWLNKSQIDDWFENWLFWRHFLLKEIARFVQTNIVSCTVHKKNAKTMSFLMAMWVFFFPWTRIGRWRRRFSPLYFPAPSLSPLVQTLHNPHSSWPTTMMEGAREPCPASDSGVAVQDRPSHLTLSSWLDRGKVALVPPAPWLDKVGWLPLPLQL